MRMRRQKDRTEMPSAVLYWGQAVPLIHVWKPRDGAPCVCNTHDSRVSDTWSIPSGGSEQQVLGERTRMEMELKRNISNRLIRWPAGLFTGWLIGWLVG
jgi:hypothetical protein